jgi:hypothetical protein
MGPLSSAGYTNVIGRCPKASAFSGITPCSLFKVNHYFGGTYRLHVQGRRMSQSRNQHEASSSTGLLLSLFIDPEVGEYVLLRNVGRRSVDYTALYPKR